jgi:hypothetical protein
VLVVIGVLIIKQRTDTINAEIHVSSHVQGDVISMETDDVCILQETGPEVSQILRWLLW